MRVPRLRRLETTDSEGLDFTKALKTFLLTSMNKTKRAARNRKRKSEAELVALKIDQISMYDTRRRVEIHNALATRGYGMVVDEVWVREYYERRTTFL